MKRQSSILSAFKCFMTLRKESSPRRGIVRLAGRQKASVERLRENLDRYLTEHRRAKTSKSVRLEHQYLEAQTAFDEAHRDLHAKVGILPGGEDLVLSRNADQAWLTV